MLLSLYQLLSGDLHKNTDKTNVIPYCISKPLNATMKVPGSPHGREKVGLYNFKNR